MFVYIRCFVVASMLFSACWSSCAAKVGEMNFPPTLGHFQLQSIIDNEKTNPGLGTTLLYNAPGVKIAIFVYDRSIRGLKEGADSAEANQEFEEAARNVQVIFPDTRKVLAKERLTIGGIPTLHSSFEYTDTRAQAVTPVISHLYLTVRRANFLKVRATYSALDQPELGKRRHLSFIEDLWRGL